MESFDALTSYGKAWLQLMKDHFDLFLLETKLAKLSIVPLISFGVLCLILFSIQWLIFLAVIGYLFYLWNLHILSAVLFTFAVNAVVLLVVLRAAKSYYKNVNFEKTRAHWKAYQQLQLGFEHENKNRQAAD